MLPIPELKIWMGVVSDMHDKDLAVGCARVFLADSIEKKQSLPSS